ncbi:hypothetical protein EYC84_010304 [Monilinia fructicola]|uniref:Uncharacterized protein n=1 Tax=Monilinia fructicola TaxID=38448 RepID=A0A5M9JH21_MONFR|nr:hypothetical protein EYC84_010304 [Monilinia fructicola]
MSIHSPTHLPTNHQRSNNFPLGGSRLRLPRRRRDAREALRSIKVTRWVSFSYTHLSIYPSIASGCRGSVRVGAAPSTRALNTCGSEVAAKAIGNLGCDS